MLRLCPFGLGKKRRTSTPSEALCKFYEMANVQLIDFLNYEILFSIYMSNLGKFISQNSWCNSGAIEQPLRSKCLEFLAVHVSVLIP